MDENQVPNQQVVPNNYQQPQYQAPVQPENFNNGQIPFNPKTMKYCKHCNGIISKKAKICPHCGGKNKKPIYKKPLFWIAVVFVLLIIAGISGSGDETSSTEKNDNSTTVETTVDKTTKPTETTAEPTETTVDMESFKASCQTYTYKDIARQPSNYEGKNMKFTGKIIQVSDNSLLGQYTSTTYRIDVTKDEYGYYDDTVYVTYVIPEGSPKFLEDDIVTFYGVCKGEETYTTVLGASVTIPSVEAKYIELVSG